MAGPLPAPLMPDAIDENRGGRLSGSQRKGFSALDRSWRHDELVGAGVAVVVGVLLLVAARQGSGGPPTFLLGVGAFVLAGVLVARAMPGLDPLSRDLRAGRVESLDGAVLKNRVSLHETDAYYLQVAGRDFEVARDTYEWAPEAGIVRIFFLPASRRVVNLERLPDRPLAPDAMTSRAALVSTARNLLSTDSNTKAEAAATFAAMGDQVQATFAKASAPPPASERDPRPLAESIVGTWQQGMATVSFAPDGTARMQMGPTHRTGHWSVTQDGRLHSDVTGSDGVADAWVAADHLTISFDGQSLTLDRVAGA